jgi:hypothetical protein
MQPEATPRLVGKSNIIHVDLGSSRVGLDAPIRITAPRRSVLADLILHLLFVVIVAFSIWACAEQSITLSANRGLDSFVERATTHDDLETAGRKCILPERS